jgi:nucleoside-diphosphate-sugar epimerase
MNIIGGNYGSNNTLVLVHPTDIAHAAAKALLALNFSGHSIEYVVSDEKTPTEIAAILGAAIGKPEFSILEIKFKATFFETPPPNKIKGRLASFSKFSSFFHVKFYNSHFI